MNVLVIYKNGSHREFRPCYIPVEGECHKAQLEQDELLTEHMDTLGIFYLRSYWSAENNAQRSLNTEKFKAIIKPAEYPSIYQIQVNGMVLLESDGEGGLKFASPVFSLD